MVQAQLTARKRLVGLDAAKTIAMLMVVALHTWPWHYSDISVHHSLAAYAALVLALSMVPVPLFLCVNGFLLFSKQELDVPRHYRKTARFFLFLSVWALILTLNSFIYNNRPLDPLPVLKMALATKINEADTGSLWFLQVIIAIYLVFPILKHIYGHAPKLFMCLCAVIALFTVGVNILRVISRLLLALTGHDLLLSAIADQISIYNVFGVWTWSLAFFLFGGILARYQETLKARWSRFFITAAAVSAAAVPVVIILVRLENQGPWYGLRSDSVFALAMVFGWMLLALKLERIRYRPIAWYAASVGRNSLGIYAVHSIFILWYRRIVDIESSLMLWLLMLPAVMIVSHLFSCAMRRIPVFSFFVTAA